MHNAPHSVTPHPTPHSEDSHIARALHVRSAPQHPVSWTNEKHSLNCIGALNFASLAQSFPKVKVSMHMHSARALQVYYVPHQGTACTIELRSLNSISEPNFVPIAQNLLEPEDPSTINFFLYWRAQSASYRNASLASAVPTV